MQQYLIQLKNSLTYQNYSPRTIDIYMTCVDIFLKWYNKDPNQIVHEDIIQFTVYLQSKDKAPKTINLYKDAIKHFAESEPAALMEKAKTEAQADLARIDASFASNVDEVANSLVESLLKGVLFPH